MRQDHKKTANRVALGCFIIMFIHLGTVGTTGLFIPQIVSSMDVTISQVSLNVTFFSLTGFFSSLLVSKLEKKLSNRYMLLIGSLAGIFHYVASAVAQNMMLLYMGKILGGITFGFGTQACSSAVISQWFTEKRATVMGIVFGGAAFGSAVMMLASGILIDCLGWRMTYIVFAALHLFVAIPANLLMLKENKAAAQEPSQMGEQPASAGMESMQDALADTDIHKDPIFWMLAISMVLCGMLVTGFKTFVPSFWQANGMSALTSSRYISMFMAIATVATMISGTIADKYGSKIYIIYLHVAFALGMAGVLLFSTKTDMLYIIIPILLVAIAYPLYGSIPAAVAGEAFGGKDYKKVCSELMAAFYIGLAGVAPIIGGLRDITGSYAIGFAIIAVLSVISCLLIILAIQKANKRRQERLADGYAEALLKSP